jgi:hypothetical protein
MGYLHDQAMRELEEAEQEYPTYDGPPYIPDLPDSMNGLMKSHELAQTIISTYPLPHLSKIIRSDRELLQLREFVKDPSKKDDILRKADLMDRSSDRPGTRAKAKGQLIGFAIATNAFEPNEIELLRKWFATPHMAKVLQKIEPVTYTGPPVLKDVPLDELMKTHRLAEKIIATHQLKPANILNSNALLLQLNEFIKDPSKKSEFLKKYGVADGPNDMPGTCANAKGQLIGFAVATDAFDKREIDLLKKWFASANIIQEVKAAEGKP